MLQALSVALEEAAESESLTDPVIDPVTDPVKKLVSALHLNGPLKISDLMAKMGLAHKATFRANYLRPALAAELIEMTHPDSPSSPAQQYRLTQLGKQAAIRLQLA